MSTKVVSAQTLKEALVGLIQEHTTRQEKASRLRDSYKEQYTSTGLKLALCHVEDLLNHEEAQKEEKKALAMRMESHAHPTESWGELKDFVMSVALGQGEYFIFDHGLDLSQGLWNEHTRQIVIWTGPCIGNGYHVSIDEYQFPQSDHSQGLSYIKNQGMGKFWSHEDALRASDLITRFVFGWPMPQSELKAHFYTARLKNQRHGGSDA